jgi:hypothetical protein
MASGGLNINWNAVAAIAQVMAALGIIASVVYLACQVQQAVRSAKADFLERFFAEWRTPEMQEARYLLENTPFDNLESFEEAFQSKVEATRARRRVKHLLAWLGNLLDRNVLQPEDVFFADLPYSLYKEEDGSDGKLLRVERDLLKKTKTEHLYEARLDSVWYAERCAQRYRDFIRLRLTSGSTRRR